MDTDPNPKDKVQWLSKLGIRGLDYGVLGLFLYIIAIEHLNQYLGRPYKALGKGIKAYKKMQFQQLSYKFYIVNVKGLRTYPVLGRSPNPYSF